MAGKPRTIPDPREAAFVNIYVKDATGNATAAAREAGYAESSVNVMANRLLKRPHIMAQIEAARHRTARRATITIDEVVDELAKIARFNIQDFIRINADGDPYVDFSGATRDQLAAIKSVSVEDFVDGRGDDARDVKRVKFDVFDKKGALEALGRHLGGFAQKNILGGGPNGDDAIPVEVKHTIRFVRADKKK